MIRKILLDSNILIHLVNNEISASKIFYAGCEYSVSIITYMEVMGFPFKNEQDEKTFSEIFNKFNIHFIDDEIASLVIKIRKAKKIKLPDAIIAATGISTHSELMTRNESDFSSIEGLTVINPFK
ncbi:MAG: type II toxin-antitoxin system VapC family toxin [Leptospiraceae bacterium]|nr:type II toxin-antitoxin system VapC family toxin [Leptospiraceae bacterium]